MCCGVALMSADGARNVAARCDPRRDMHVPLLADLTCAAVDLPWVDVDPDTVRRQVAEALRTGAPLPASRTETPLRRHRTHLRSKFRKAG